LDEAQRELVSGKDIFQGKWPVPRLIAVPLEEALANPESGLLESPTQVEAAPSVAQQ
jgi:hypothetical protein